MNYLNITNFVNKILKKLNSINVKVQIKNIAKNPLKYIFYIISIILPLFAYILLDDLKLYTIFLLSFTTFLNYLNVCVFEKLCLLKQQSCKINENDIRESLVVGLITFLFMWFSKITFNLFSGK